MLFNSAAFAVFLPIVLLLYYSLRTRWQNRFLIAASYVFYGWWDWRFCGLLIFSTVLDYGCARGIASGSDRRRRLLLAASIVGNLGVLGFFKYFDFFIESAASLLNALGFDVHPHVLRIVLPVGISFYTFQTMAYTIDVYRGVTHPRHDFSTVALYVSYFPQLVAGPIERPGHLMSQIERPRRVSQSDLSAGIWLILVGLFRKIAIADAVAPAVDQAFAHPESASWGQLLVGALLFAVQIYGDFAGYSGIARGVSRLLGIDLMVNFRQPYMAQNITDFWRRWHISLSTWLRDYLYIPLGGNRHGKLKQYRNLMLTMLLGGLWHGANWTFVVWGGLHGLYLSGHKFISERRSGQRQGAEGGAGRLGRALVGTSLTLILVLIAWVFFRAPTLSSALEYLTGIATLRGGPPGIGVTVRVLFYVTLVLLVDIPERMCDTRDPTPGWSWPVRGLAIAGMILLIILLRPEHETPFIYFQF